MRIVKQILSTILAMLREIFDESAYARYLEKNQLCSSRRILRWFFKGI